MAGSKGRLVRMALSVNATVAALCGLALLLMGSQAAGHIVALPHGLVAGLGVLLIGFAGLAGVATIRFRVGWVLLVAAADLVWLGAMVALSLVSGLVPASGLLWVVATSVAVAALVGVLLCGLRSWLRDGEGGPGRYRHCIRVRTSAPAAALWSVVADLAAIHHFSGSLASSRLRSDGPVGVGSVRDCTNTKNETWSEAVELFDPEARRLTVRFLTEAPNFPFPVSTLVGGWAVAEDGDGSIVDVWWSLTPTTPLGWLVVALMTIPLDGDMPRVIARMAEVARGGAITAPSLSPSRSPRLAYC